MTTLLTIMLGSSGSAGPGPALFSTPYRSEGADGANSTAYPLCDNNQDAPVCRISSTLALTSVLSIYPSPLVMSTCRWIWGHPLKWICKSCNAPRTQPSTASMAKNPTLRAGRLHNSFICNYFGGVIATTDYYFAATLNDSVRLLSSLMGCLLDVCCRDMGDLLFSLVYCLGHVGDCVDQ
ncbi:hypothetical protein NE237_021324 [Protea cynaroides]|uniref:Uncharacterized protein n=1 Tax=Protea cynaroides TaxID=273540 RepID=A0A9Q0K2H8_9MAGN|nr:hypothetical protein NE237_021324 [Protea cynaroides]